MKSALVTGGAGFIGSHVSEALVKEGYHVRILDNLSTGKSQNLAAISQKIDLWVGDLTDFVTVSRAAEGMDFIFHLGAIPSVVRSVEDPLRVHQANVLGTLHVLLAARAAKVKRVVYTSSSSVYGDQPVSPKVESMKLDPLSPYAATKLGGEYYANIFHSIYQVPTISLRYFNVFGPRQDPNSVYAAVVPRFITRVLKGEPPIIYGDGSQTRDFTYVEDVVKANLMASTAPESALGKAYNIAGGRSVSLLGLLSEIQSILGTSILPIFEQRRPGDVLDSLASVEMAQKNFGFKCSFSLKEGLLKTINSFKNHS